MIEKITALSLRSTSEIGNFIQSNKGGSDNFKTDILTALGRAGTGRTVYAEMIIELVANQGDKLDIANEIWKRAKEFGSDTADLAECIIESLQNIPSHKGRITYVQGGEIMGCRDKTYASKYAPFVNKHVDDISIKMGQVVSNIYDLME